MQNTLLSGKRRSRASKTKTLHHSKSHQGVFVTCTVSADGYRTSQTSNVQLAASDVGMIGPNQKSGTTAILAY